MLLFTVMPARNIPKAGFYGKFPAFLKPVTRLSRWNIEKYIAFMAAYAKMSDK